MRKAMKKLYGKRGIFVATVEKKSATGRLYRNIGTLPIPTYMLKDIKFSQDRDHVLTSHVWIKPSAMAQDVPFPNLEPGDIIEFDAYIDNYIRQGKHRGAVDYTFASIREVVVIGKLPVAIHKEDEDLPDYEKGVLYD